MMVSIKQCVEVLNILLLVLLQGHLEVKGFTNET